MTTHFGFQQWHSRVERCRVSCLGEQAYVPQLRDEVTGDRYYGDGAQTSRQAEGREDHESLGHTAILGYKREA